MPINEFECLKHGKFEKIVTCQSKKTHEKCPVCGQASSRVEWSVPARRNPDAGIQR